jgi:hypothetical protein
MSGNKAFITTPGNAVGLQVAFPPFTGPFYGPPQWIATYGQIGGTATNIASATQDGVGITILGAATTSPITVWIQIM